MQSPLALMRALLSMIVWQLPDALVPRRGCCGSWLEVIVRVIVFIIIVWAMVKLSVAGVLPGAAATVILFAGLVTAKILSQVFGPGTTTA